MNLFGNSCKKLLDNYENFFEALKNRTELYRMTLPKDRQSVLLAIILASDGMIVSQLEAIAYNAYKRLGKLSKFVDKDANIFEIVAYSCFMRLNRLRNQTKHNSKLGDKLDFDLLVSDLSNILNIGKEYFDYCFRRYDELIRSGKDPRDLIFDQKIDFIQTMMKRNFSFKDRVSQNMETIIWFNVYVFELIISEDDEFEKLLNRINEQIGK